MQAAVIGSGDDLISPYEGDAPVSPLQREGYGFRVFIRGGDAADSAQMDCYFITHIVELGCATGESQSVVIARFGLDVEKHSRIQLIRAREAHLADQIEFALRSLIQQLKLRSMCSR